MPTIATRDELHTANSLTQITQWTAQAIGSFLGGVAVLGGYHLAFGFNAFSFLFSAACIWQLRVPGGFHARRAERLQAAAAPDADTREPLTEDRIVRPWHEYLEGLRYMRATPLIFGIGLISVGWATGGGAAQILLSLFGDVVFKRGSIGIGAMWGSAGSGLILGAIIAHRIFPRLSFRLTRSRFRSATFCTASFFCCSAFRLPSPPASFSLACPAPRSGVSSVSNSSQLLRHVGHEFRGRVFSTIETWTWMTMMVSMSVAGWASDHASPRVIGAVAAAFSTSTAFWWGWANFAGKLPEPALDGVDPAEIEVHGEPAA